MRSSDTVKSKKESSMSTPHLPAVAVPEGLIEAVRAYAKTKKISHVEAYTQILLAGLSALDQQGSEDLFLNGYHYRLKGHERYV